jgi:glucokinase
MAATLAMAVQHPVVGAVDIGGTKVAVAALDASGRVLAKDVGPTNAASGFDAGMARIAAMLEAVRTRAAVELRGIGIGCTGPIDPMSGEIGTVEYLAGWRGCNPVERLTARFGLKVAMENDADSAALGEFYWGAGRGKRHVVCVTVGTGIGGGIVLNGALFRGLDGAHPELGHHTIEASGPQCYCGARGCWEVLASGSAMAARAERDAPADYPHRDRLSAQGVCELARRGDPFARREVEREAHYLGVGVANLVTLYAPEVIVLSGSVMDSAELFMPAIRAAALSSCNLVPAARVEISLSAQGSDAALIGAGAVWHHRYRQH